MAKMKVHELAKELDIQSKDVITFLGEKGIEVKAAQSSIEDDAIEMVKKKFGKAAPKTEAPKQKPPRQKLPRQRHLQKHLLRLLKETVKLRKRKRKLLS